MSPFFLHRVFRSSVAVLAALVTVAVAGFWSKRDAIGWLLLVWCVVTLARTFGAPYFSHAWNLIPGVSLAAFYRYACPSWELALVLLAARGIDIWTRSETTPGVRAAAGTVLVAGLAVTAGIVASRVWPLIDTAALRNWAAGSMLIATLAALTGVLLAGRGPRAAAAIATVLTVEAILMFAIPMLANPRGGRVV